MVPLPAGGGPQRPPPGQAPRRAEPARPASARADADEYFVGGSAGRSLVVCSNREWLEAILKRVLVSWSSGKDSAWALSMLLRNPQVEVRGLLCTLNEKFQRVAMHGTRRSVLEAQAQATGLPLWTVPLPWPC